MLEPFPSKMETAATPIIEAANLRKTYGSHPAVDGVSFHILHGEVFGILGPNGAGKTTTIEILEGMRRPDSGTAFVNGINVVDDPRGVKSVIGIQLQSSAFFDKLSLAEILSVFASFFRRRVQPAEILAQVEMEDRTRARYKDLSGGQKQRFSIAAALVNDPPILFLDEPTTGLDPQSRRHMWELVQKFQSQGKTILLTTHYMEEAEELCGRVAIMDHGQIVALDNPASLVYSLLARGFTKPHVERQANLEDVFLDLTGRQLRDG